MNLDLRQTGRSTRTRDRAIELAFQGQSVYLLVQTRKMIRINEIDIDKTWVRLHRDAGSHGIKVEAFDHHWADQWNWETMRPMSRFHSNCVFLMDHSVVEEKILQLQKRAAEIIAMTRKLYQETV